jgi:hypothetical protein
MANLDYYDFSPIRSYNATYNVIAGARGLGKSFGFKDICLNDWFKKREQFFYLRRYKDEISKSGPLFFDDVAYKFPHADFRVRGSVGEVASAETRGQKKREWETIGYFGALSVGQQYKSVPFPLVTKIGYDEFILEKGNVPYLRDEVAAFNNFFSTVDRYKEKTKAFLLANAVEMTNPFFIEWDIRPDEGKEFQTRHSVTMKDGSKRPFIVVHLPEASKFARQVSSTGFGQFLSQSDPEYAEYAVNNKFADAHTELIAPKTSDSKYRFTLETQSQIVSIWFDLASNRFFVTRKRPRAGEKIFTLEKAKAGPGKVVLEYGSRPLSVVRTAYNQGRMYFDTPATRNLFLDVFKRS